VRMLEGFTDGDTFIISSGSLTVTLD